MPPKESERKTPQIPLNRRTINTISKPPSLLHPYKKRHYHEKSVPIICQGTETNEDEKPPIKPGGYPKTSQSVMPTTSHQIQTPEVSGCSDFILLLLASCKPRESDSFQKLDSLMEGNQSFELDLSTFSPLLRRAIKIAVLNKLEQIFSRNKSEKVKRA